MVATFAELDVANSALSVDQVVRRPEAVAVVGPRAEVVVERDGVFDRIVLGTGLHVGGNLLKGVLGGVHADDVQPEVLVSVVPTVDVRHRTLAVDAGVGPEVDQNDFAAQLIQGDCFIVLGVEPLLNALNVGCSTAALELGSSVGALVEVLVLLVDETAEVELFCDLF